MRIPLLLALLLPVAAAAPPAESPPAAPAPPPSPWGPIEHAEGGTPAQVLVKGEPYTYFRMARRWPIRFSVRGPARLIIISRASLAEGSEEPVTYYVRVLAAHSVLKTQKPVSGPAPDARLADSAGVRLTESRRLVVPIHDGEQPIWIQVGGAPSVFVRVLFEPPEGPEWAKESLTPVKPFRAVPVAAGGAEAPYYSVAKGKPVAFETRGPARLEINSRLDCEAGARYSTPYTLVVMSGEDTLRAARYLATRSEDATFARVRGRVPSEMSRTVVPLGPGPARVEVELADPPDRTAVIRARLLRPSEEGED